MAEYKNAESRKRQAVVSMSDYINREMAADCIVLECDDVTLEQARQAIKDCPSADVVEVVRCKDCKFWDSDCIWCDLWGNTQEYYDGYCSYGERKYDDECK